MDGEDVTDAVNLLLGTVDREETLLDKGAVPWEYELGIELPIDFVFAPVEREMVLEIGGTVE